MQLRKVIERKLRRAAPGVDAQSDVHAVVAANVGERGSVTNVTSKQTATAGGKTKPGPDHGA
jgi:hypothetical protein